MISSLLSFAQPSHIIWMRPSNANLEINGRSSLFDCLELTEIGIPLLGVLPMEALGIEPDLHNQSLRMLGAEEGNSYIYAM